MDGNPAAIQLMQMINGYQVSQAICVAAALGVADQLKDGSRTSDDLAMATHSHPEALYRLLRALASVGVLHEGDARRFSLTALGSGLRSDAPQSVAPWARLVERTNYRQAWSELLHSVRTGENAFHHAHRMGVWQYRSEHPEESVIFDRAMTALSSLVADAVLAAYDFGQFEVVMDVGGGQGALLAKILSRHPGQRGILFDQPQVVAGAAPTLESALVADRCQIVGGDFFASVPDGADAHVLKWIIHDWDDARAIAVLKSCRRAIRPGGKLVVLEAVLAPPNEGAPAKFADLNMLTVPGGQERTAEEFAKLFDAGGFNLTRTIDAGPRISIIEGKPA